VPLLLFSAQPVGAGVSLVEGEPVGVMLRLRVMRLLLGIVFVVALTGCGSQVAAVSDSGEPCDPGAGISVNHASEGGEQTSLAAAERLGESASGSPLYASSESWKVVTEEADKVILASGDVEATVVRLDDGTWIVDGARCVGD
jgi:hypothetical protein